MIETPSAFSPSITFRTVASATSVGTPFRVNAKVSIPSTNSQVRVFPVLAKAAYIEWGVAGIPQADAGHGF